VTHAHYDHMDGIQDLLKRLDSIGYPAPKVFKRIDGNFSEKMRFKNNPILKTCLFNIKDSDTFHIDGITISPVHTPGHLSDHLCYLIKEPCGTQSLFTGDHIIGANSTYFDDYPSYFESLVKT